MLKILLFCIFLSLILSCTTRHENATIDPAIVAKQDTVPPLKVTVLSELPDSLQPKHKLLDTMPKPSILPFPKTKAISYKRTSATGEVIIIPLEVPVPVSPPVLKNDKGEEIKDSEGNPFILGDGGIGQFTTFSTDNGLALDAVQGCCIDHFGNLWIGTSGGGVCRYDGKNFTTYTSAQGLANNVVYSVMEDKHGNMWFGTAEGGVSRYDGTSFTTYSTAQGLVNNFVWCILEDKTGNLWFGTQGGLSRYDGKHFTNFTTAQGLVNNSVRSIEEDRHGNLWFGTQGGASRYDGKNFTNFTTAQGLADNNVICILEDKTGILWFATFYGGVSRYDDQQITGKDVGTFTALTTAQGLANNSVICIAEDLSGNLWFGTQAGVSRYEKGKFPGDSLNANPGKFTTFTTSEGLAHKLVSSIVEDKSGNLWFGTLGGGLSRYDGSSFTKFSTSQGLANNNVRCVTEDHSGNLWFATLGAGVSRYDGKTFTSYSISQGLGNNTIVSIIEDKTGKLWFGSLGGGVICFDGTNFTNYKTQNGLASDLVFTIKEDKNGIIWFGTRGGGVSMYDGKSFTNYSTRQGLANNTVRCIYEDRAGNLWFGTQGGGTSRYDGKSFTTYSTAQGLINNVVYCINEDKAGNLWFCTQKGLSLIPAEKREHSTNTPGKLFINFTTDDGLPDNFVTQILEYSEHKLYAGTNAGICEILLQEGEWKVGDVFNTSTGYPVKDVNASQSTLFKDSKGSIWIATGSSKTALVRFNPEAVQKNNLPTTVLINQLRVDENPVPWQSLVSTGDEQDTVKIKQDSIASVQSEAMTIGKVLSVRERDSLKQRYAGITFDHLPPFYPLPENLVLPFHHNSVSFDFISTEKRRNFMVRYQYILEGYNKNWSQLTDKTSAVFGNMNEGDYTFKVKARSPEGIWSEPVTYTFTVLPPWWRTWWAYMVYLLLGLFVLRMFIKWRERNLRMENEKLERTVDIRTAEVVAEKKKSDDLLLNILPEEVAEELKTKGSAEAKQFHEVTVMFTDFKGFTQISEKLSPKELVSEIDNCFKAFDNIITRHNIEKIKTIGDSYMCAGGLPVVNNTHAEDVVKAALEIQQFMNQHLQQRRKENSAAFEIRIGIHTGPVVAGIVGVKKFAYDIWGDTVNIASGMESSSEAGKINISGTTFQLVKDKFNCIHRGKIQAKNKGEVDMYFVERAS